MTKIKENLLNRIVSLHTEIENIDKQIAEKISNTQTTEKTEVIQMGSFGLRAQELNIQLFTIIDIFLNDAEGTEDELPEEALEYYNLVNTIRQPPLDTDTEEIKQIKDLLSSLKKNG